MESFIIKTPCSSANIGPGFDVIGLALSMYLELHVTIDRSKTASSQPLHCRITYEGEGEGGGEISLDPEVNLITRVALYVLRCHDRRSFPLETHVHIKNPIPLGRGLGSSGAAVVAGVMLGKECGALHHLTPERLFDFCPCTQTFNLQRIALLPVALGQSPPDPELIYLAMQDKLHQPYRQTLIPGLTEIVESMTPGTQPGLLGVCLSGAGPTILALATSNFADIAGRIIAKFKENRIVCNWKVLEPAEGTTVVRS
ncbi:homoserine kinase [Parathielavia hyrcaniae]|uniref:Homoserine kinase n=1 Tax=Parathielavia hyrcaniae TaxID=113614 RepID=A0AAN6Q6U5_9PEZI|nr:homoserine kinase [Parathielavia hyrcaniae]